MAHSPLAGARGGLVLRDCSSADVGAFGCCSHLPHREGGQGGRYRGHFRHIVGDVGVRGWTQHGELTCSSCTSGRVTRLGGTCLLCQHHSTGVAGEGEAALSAVTYLASFWFSSPEIGPKK